MTWQLRIDVRDASGGPVNDAILQLSTRAAIGGFDTAAPKTIGASPVVPLPDTVVEIVVSLVHARFAPLVVSLVRGPAETVWRWNEANLHVTVAGRLVTVAAVLSRLRLAPLISVSEDELKRRAEQAKAPLDSAARAHKPPRTPPEAVRIDNLTGMLRDTNFFYRNSFAAPERAYHILAPRPLGEPGRIDWPVDAPGWGRFATTVRAAAPGTGGRLRMFEYGEVAASNAAPRFLVAVWIPPQFVRAGATTIDFVVWFTPNTRLPNYLRVEYPFRGDYPYVLMAHGTGPYTANQNYGGVGFGHLLASHRLAYQMLAAQRAAAIVIPVAPSSHFELWESPVTLMRMLKELCRGMPRDDDGRIAKVHPAPPTVGRVAVAGFSAAGRRLSYLLDGNGADSHYQDPVWGGQADRRDFNAAWRELWCIDGNFGSEHGNFLDKATRWTRQDNDRQLRVYKNDFTDGRWDPRAAGGEFGWAMAKAVSVQRGGGQHWAVHSTGLDGRIQALSMSKSYAVSPGGALMPQWDEKARPHENMPLLSFGHAVATSGFGRLEGS